LHLFNEEIFKKSSTTYFGTLFFEKIALRSFHASGLWKKMLTMDGILMLTIDEVSSLGSELCEEF
jgi:hypothetical protein